MVTMIALVIVNATDPARKTIHALNRVASERSKSASLSVNSAMNIGAPTVTRTLIVEVSGGWIVFRLSQQNLAFRAAVRVAEKACLGWNLRRRASFAFPKRHLGLIMWLEAWPLRHRNLVRLLADIGNSMVGAAALD